MIYVRVADPQKAEKEFLRMTNEIEPRERSHGYADSTFAQDDKANGKMTGDAERERFRYKNSGLGKVYPSKPKAAWCGAAIRPHGCFYL